MCLEKVDILPKVKYGMGYKLVEKKIVTINLDDPDGEIKYLCWDYQPMEGKVEYPLNKWIKDKNTERIIGPGAGYPPGFHCALDIKPLVEWMQRHSNFTLVIIKVKFRKVVATGEDWFDRVAVAKEIKNLGEVEWRSE